MYKAAWILLVIGGLNWLLFGLLGWEVGHLLGGMESVLSRIVYIVVGLSALVVLFSGKKKGAMKHSPMPEGGQM